ncbi:hypothetical protein [Salegentibacter sp.]|uniref:hypothetical protein n=1 Tax=Salegentibacter sp. TaxID=1903072 RepID=UPI00356251AC
MAEIKVEKKKPIWPWIVGILAVLLIIFLLFTYMDDDNGTDDSLEERDEQVEESIDPFETEDDRDLAYPENAVGQYLYYIDEEYPEREVEENEEFPQEAMQKLAEAVQERSWELEGETNQELEELAGNSAETEIQRDGDIIVNALADLQRRHYEGLEDEITELRSDLEEINQTEGEEQAEAIDDFFSQAAEVLREMPPQRGGATMERSQPTDTGDFSTDLDTIEADDN